MHDAIASDGVTQDAEVEAVERAMWLTYFNDYLFDIGYISQDEMLELEELIKNPELII